MAERSGEETAQMWLAYQANPHNLAVRNRLVERYLPIVRYYAARLRTGLPPSVELDDLVSAGVFGLIDAIEAFDAARGVKFESYCVLRIRGAMLDELRATDWVPQNVRKKANTLKRARLDLERRLGRDATEGELAAALGLSVAELEQLTAEASGVDVGSLDVAIYDTDSNKEVCYGDLREDKKGEAPTERIEAQDLMRRATRGLRTNERLVILLYYYSGLNMREIAESLGVSQSYVSILHKRALIRIREQFSGINLGPAFPKEKNHQ